MFLRAGRKGGGAGCEGCLNGKNCIMIIERSLQGKEGTKHRKGTLSYPRKNTKNTNTRDNERVVLCT